MSENVAGQVSLEWELDERPKPKVMDPSEAEAREALNAAYDAACIEDPDTTLLARRGPQVPLTDVHCQLMADMLGLMEAWRRPVEQVAKCGADGRVTLVERYRGSKPWVVSAHRGEKEEWLSVAWPDGTPIAQRNTDLSDSRAIAFGMLVLSGWADDQLDC